MENSTHHYHQHLGKTPANHQPLTPLQFLERAAWTYPERTSVIHGEKRMTWSETRTRCHKLADALSKRGIGKGDTVAVMAANTPEMMELHFGAPLTGAVLNTINTRLDAAIVGFILDHGEASVVFVDKEYSDVMAEALEIASVSPFVIDIDDPEYDGDGQCIGEADYEGFIAGGDESFPYSPPDDEWDAISLNYTSGTTGDPKGVVYHHRGAYLNAVSNVLTWSMPQHPVYLWTLPMFHCNGWCFPWGIALQAGTHVCLRAVRAKPVFDAIADHKVDHFCGAPIVLNLIANAPAADRRTFDHTVKIMTAAAPPPPSTLEMMEDQGFDVTHVYGLTETYGPSVVCAWNEDWDGLSPADRAAVKARQGVRYAMLEGLDVIDPETMQSAPHDGETIAEVMMQGNIVMKGYLKNPAATDAAFAGGWFHSGDLGVMHEDGYVALKDRSKDIIISGGENISSVEVEQTLYRFPAVAEAAVVAKPDEKWGETPCAFIELKNGVEEPAAEDVIQFCRENMAGFKCPRHVVFGLLPKTSTGKVQKFVLRERAKEI
jgi:fatty-acyl-CoA synthase